MKKAVLAMFGFDIGFAIMLFITFLNRDDVILYHGIKGYRTTFVIMVATLTVMCIATVVCAFLSRVLNNKHVALYGDSKEDAAEQDQLERKQAKLYRQLKDMADERWHILTNKIYKIISDLDSMNEYQKNLKQLLHSNEASEFFDSVNVLQQIENAMYGNVRNLLNYLQVLPTSEKEEASDRIVDCKYKNKELLDKTKELLLDITASINDADTEAKDRALFILKSYRETILGGTSLEDKYLN